MPRDPDLADRLLHLLRTAGVQTTRQLADKTGRQPNNVQRSLLAASARGVPVDQVGTGTWRARDWPTSSDLLSPPLTPTYPQDLTTYPQGCPGCGALTGHSVNCRVHRATERAVRIDNDGPDAVTVVGELVTDRRGPMGWTCPVCGAGVAPWSGEHCAPSRTGEAG